MTFSFVLLLNDSVFFNYLLMKIISLPFFSPVKCTCCVKLAKTLWSPMAPCRTIGRSQVMTHPFITHMNGCSLTRYLTRGHCGDRAHLCCVCMCAYTSVCLKVSLHVTWQLKDIDCELMCWQGIHKASFAHEWITMSIWYTHWCIMGMYCIYMCVCVMMPGVHSVWNWKGHCTLVVPAAKSQKPTAREPAHVSNHVVICWPEREMYWYSERERKKQREHCVPLRGLRSGTIHSNTASYTIYRRDRKASCPGEPLKQAWIWQ